MHAYEHDPSHESFGLEASEKLGVEPARVFKTLVASADGTLTVALVPVDRQLDLKALAATVKAKSATMADVAIAQRTTGYVVGAISPLGQKKQLRTVVDSSAERLETMYVSAGKRGLEIELAPLDLFALTGAQVAAIAR